jgi:hypothetical protein
MNDTIHSSLTWLALGAQLLLATNALVAAGWWRALPAATRWLLPFLVVDLLTEILVSWCAEQGINNMPLLHAYTLLEFVTLSVFYWFTFADWLFFRRFLWIFMGVGAVLLTANSIWVEPIDQFNTNSRVFVQVTMIAYATAYFFRSFGRADFTQIQSFGAAMAHAGILTYHSGSLFIFMFSNALNDPNFGIPLNAQATFWLFNGVLFLVFQLLISVALWSVVFNPKRSPHS